MKRKFLAFALALAPLSFGLIYPATAAEPQAPITYNFEGNLDRVEGPSGSILELSPTCGVDLDNPCNSSTSFGSTKGDGYWAWSTESENGGGFSLDTEDNLTSTYTIYLKFTFDDVDGYNGYNKIIDYLNRTSDTGFYMWSNKIKFYDLGASTSEFTPGEPLTLMVVRDASQSGGLFTVYSYNGSTFTKELEVVDEDGESIPSDSTVMAGGTRLGFFYDDGNGEGTPSGKIWSLKIWPAQALSAADLEALATTPDTEPTTPPTDEEEETLADTGFDGGQAIFWSMLLLITGAGLLAASRFAKRN